MNNTEKVIAAALRYLNEQEMKGNVFNSDTELGRKLKKAGHINGEAWCALFMEVVFCDAFPESEKWLTKYFSKAAVGTFNNFIKAGCKMNEFPEPGDLVVWQKYKDGSPTAFGHIGLCIKTQKDFWRYNTIEGNTNVAGSREGTTVLKRAHTKQTQINPNGLNYLGSVTIYDRSK